VNRLPSLREAKQLCRLRALRVQRARERCAQAQIEVDRAAQAVRDRQRLIVQHQREIDALKHAVVHELAPHLPRWSDLIAAQNKKLVDRLERDESDLIDDEHSLEVAQEKLQQARAEVTRALAREDAVTGLARETRRAQLLERERRAEVELEDQGRPGSATHRSPA
jgi:hypothetical protein